MLETGDQLDLAEEALEDGAVAQSSGEMPGNVAHG
jgi:hypothetical protein